MPARRSVVRVNGYERMVNEMLHQDDGSAFAGKSDSAAGAAAENGFQEKVRETMEKAFWDLVTDSTILSSNPPKPKIGDERTKINLRESIYM